MINKEKLLSSKFLAGIHPIGSLQLSKLPISLIWEGDTPEIAASLGQATTPKINTFVIAGILGTESSRTPQGQRSNIDYNLGLRASYFVGNKIGINVGGSFINDGFSAPGEDYRSPKDFWNLDHGQ